MPCFKDDVSWLHPWAGFNRNITTFLAGWVEIRVMNHY